MFTVHECIALAFICATFTADGLCIRPDNNPDIELRTPELLAKYGYRVEIHRVITSDGYILEIHRIVGKISSTDFRSPSRGMVLLQHGLGGSSADWVLTGPKKSLAYILADHGYDVWLGNSRGNLYSRNHTFLSPEDRYFWDFSWHEIGAFDLPATIDHMLTENSGFKKIFYVGHSQGTTAFLVMASERPEYNDKISLMAAFAPAAYTANLRGPVTKLATLTQLGVWIGERFGYPEFQPRSTWGKFVASYICRDEAATQFFCSTIIFLIAGFSPDELEPTSLPVIVGHVPAGASWKQFIHYGQGTMEPGRFKQFDYANPTKHLQLYNSTEPPEYRLERISAPLAFFKSENDWLATPKDVYLLESRLNSLIFTHNVSEDRFNHYDFLWGKHAPLLVYEKLLQLLEDYSCADAY